MITIQNTALAFTAITTALMSGLFFAFSNSVTPGLGKLNDSEYITAMQSINKTIQNPIFFLVFFGALLSLPVTTYLHYSKPIPEKFWILLIGTIIYIAGVFGMTVFGNIPLNNSLEKFNLLNASKEAISSQRILFEKQWNNLNLVRTISSLLTLLLVILSCFEKRQA